MNKQEIFNQVYLGLKSQGFQRSVSDNGDECMYRNADGLKCAIGHLMLDEEYHIDIEYSGLTYLFTVAENPPDTHFYPSAGRYSEKCERVKKFFERLEVRSQEDKDFLKELQSTHDYPSPDGMKSCLERFAERNGLTIPGEDAK